MNRLALRLPCICLGSTYVHFLGAVLLSAILLCFPHSAVATDLNPLRPADTSSPRATLQGFVTSVDEIYRQLKDVIEPYSRSDRLYLTSEERRSQADLVNNASKAAQYLDLSGVLPVLKPVVGFERVLQLKEILDRIELPPLDDTPDQQAMARTSSKKWRIPNTEIDIALIENGSRAGDYFISCLPKRLSGFPNFTSASRPYPTNLALQQSWLTPIAHWVQTKPSRSMKPIQTRPSGWTGSYRPVG
jgi:MscS family membrane protein